MSSEMLFESIVTSLAAMVNELLPLADEPGVARERAAASDLKSTSNAPAA
jgi:hypothetical protein